jgi:hypothetical protein
MKESRTTKWLVNEHGEFDEVFAQVAYRQGWRCPLCTLPLYVFTEVDFDYGPSGELRGILCEVCHQRLSDYEGESARSCADLRYLTDTPSVAPGEPANLTDTDGLKELDDASTDSGLREARAVLVHSEQLEDAGYTQASPNRPGSRQTVWRIKPPKSD